MVIKQNDDYIRIGRKGRHSILDLIKACKKYGLTCTDEMVEWARTHSLEINGCGAKGGTKFPETMLFLEIVWACYLHDIRWGMATTKEALHIGNYEFETNLERIVDMDSCCTFVKWMRSYRITTYINAIKYVGTQAEIARQGL